MSHCWKESVCWIRTRLIYASTLASIGGGGHLLVLHCSVGPVSLSALGELNAVDILKVKSSLEHALPRFRTPRQCAAGHTAVVQYLDAFSHMSFPGFTVKNLIHPLAGRQSWIAQTSRTVPSSGKRPVIDQRVTLDWKRLRAVEVGLAVRLPFERARDPLVTKETQLGRAAFLGKVLFVALIDMPPSLRSRAPETVEIVAESLSD
jgi:hypothetical protein